MTSYVDLLAAYDDMKARAEAAESGLKALKADWVARETELIDRVEAAETALITSQMERDRLRHTLRMIAIVDQGCGGNLSFEEMANSAMRQARAALEAKP